MTELVLVLLFTVAGVTAALLALRLVGDMLLVRWLVWAFCLLAVGNLALHVWPVVADDPDGSARIAAIAAALAVIVWAYRRFLRALRRRIGGADAHRVGRPAAGMDEAKTEGAAGSGPGARPPGARPRGAQAGGAARDRPGA